MILGVFLAIGESLADFKKKGQDKLLINSNFKTYSKNYDKVYIFSYGNEKLKLYKNVIVLPNKYNLHRYLYSIILPLLYSKEIESCNILRGYQITGGIPGILTKFRFNKKIIVNYGYPYPAVALIEKKRIRALLYKLITKIVGLISYKIIITSNELISYLGRQKTKRVLIPNSVNTNLFKPLRLKKEYDIIFIGRLEKQKNHAILIDAVSKLVNHKILFIGNGTLKNKLISYAKRRKVLLTIIDKVPHNQLPEYYNKSRIFILPSVIEGNPKVLLEAMSCGIPCIGNNIPSVNNIIKHYNNGLIFNNLNSLVKSIQIINSNIKLAQKLGSNARNYIINNFNYQRLSLREIELLKSSVQ